MNVRCILYENWWERYDLEKTGATKKGKKASKSEISLVLFWKEVVYEMIRIIKAIIKKNPEITSDKDKLIYIVSDFYFPNDNNHGLRRPVPRLDPTNIDEKLVYFVY